MAMKRPQLSGITPNGRAVISWLWKLPLVVSVIALTALMGGCADSGGVGQQTDMATIQAQAAAGNIADQEWLGHNYWAMGNYSEAMYWLRRAAEAGNVMAMDGVATCYARGNGVPRDYAKALAWYRRAAEAGCADAMFGIGLMYYHGHGVSADRAKAFHWMRKAAVAGDQAATNWMVYHSM